MSLLITSKLLIIWTVINGYEFHCNGNNRFSRRLDVSYGSPAYKFCGNQLESQLAKCGRKNDGFPGDIRIVGGKESVENEYPWMALIMGTEQRLICGGSLINDRYVVSAAHCLALGYDQKEMKVALGEFDRCNADTHTVIFSIDKLIVHPRYDDKKELADIMLVRLNMRVTFNKFVRPICLPDFEPRISTAKKFGGRFVTALGWGSADTPQKVCTLRSVSLEVLRPKDCEMETATVICAGLNDGGRDACQGDSGGPLQIINSRERYELIGVTSMGIGCGNGYPGLYTDVVSMVPWIMKITTQDSMYCWR